MNNMLSKNLGLTFSLLICVHLTACEQEVAEVKPEEIRPVRAEKVVLNKFRKITSYAGEVKARYVTNLGFRVAGKLIERKVDVGAEVTKGQLLARIDPTDYHLNVLRREAEENAARADLEKASADLQRYKSLLEKKVVSRNEFEHYQNLYNTAEARLKQMKALLDVDQNQALYTDLYVDTEGVITDILAEVGQVLAQGQPILRLAQLQEQEIALSIPENQLEELQKANDFNISLWAYPNLKLKGHLREISPTADPVTRTYNIRITLLNPPPEVHLGMTATVTLQQSSPQAVALIPLTALYAQGEQTAVWIVDTQNYQVNLVRIQLGEFYENAVTVLSGLQNGQWVVTAGTHKLHKGQKVRLLGEQKI